MCPLHGFVEKIESGFIKSPGNVGQSRPEKIEGQSEANRKSDAEAKEIGAQSRCFCVFSMVEQFHESWNCENLGNAPPAKDKQGDDRDRHVEYVHLGGKADHGCDIGMLE